MLIQEALKCDFGFEYSSFLLGSSDAGLVAVDSSYVTTRKLIIAIIDDASTQLI